MDQDQKGGRWAQGQATDDQRSPQIDDGHSQQSCIGKEWAICETKTEGESGVSMGTDQIDEPINHSPSIQTALVGQ
jgi:hypothetical protein